MTARAYYNEHDKKTAAWLRELIKAGLIADGDVDERSIEDVAPTELTGYAQCHFFAGIGGWSYALRLAGWPDDRPVWTGSCPCQPFSSAGKANGSSDPRHLWPTWFWLISQCLPVAVFGEQVASESGLSWFDLVASDFESQNYAIGAACIAANSIGSNHERKRLFFAANPSLQQGIHKPDARKAKARLPDNKTYWEAHPWDEAEPKVCSIYDGFPSYVGIYHGFGNAIVPQVAQVFIESYLDAIGG